MKIKHPYLIGESSLELSIYLIGLHLYEESIQYSEAGISWVKNKNDKEQLYALMLTQSIAFYRLGMYEKAKRQLEDVEKGLPILRKDAKYANLAANTYLYLSDVHNNLGHFDYSIKYLDKMPALFDLMSEVNRIPVEVNYYYEKGQKFLHHENADSAYFYLRKSYETVLPFDDYIIYRPMYGLGNYFLAQNQYDSAVHYYLQAVNIIDSTDLQDMLVEDVYKNIATAYQGIGDESQSNYYLSRHADVQQKNMKAQRDDVEKVVNILQSKEEKKQKKITQRLISLSVFIALLACGIFIIYYKTKIKKRKITSALIKKEKTVLELNKKVNEAFDDIIQMAKDNNPLFWSRFQEVYPNFREKLLEINPDLKATELTLCAYICLGFSTKEIADYTFKAEKTIRNNRHNLRKRLRLETDEDIRVWMRRLIV